MLTESVSANGSPVDCPAFQDPHSVTRNKSSALGIEVADQVEQAVTVHVLAAGVAEGQTAFITTMANVSDVGSMRATASNVGLDKIATGIVPLLPGFMLLGKPNRLYVNGDRNERRYRTARRCHSVT